MTAPIKQSSFSGGEIAPFLYGRTEQVKYETGLRTMRNFLAMRHGGATNRPGTQYVGTTQNGGNAVRLIPFIFNETGNGQSYVLEFGNGYIGFYQNGGVIMSGGIPYLIASPYTQADIANLKFDESADVITITHPSYPPYELKRLAATNWTLTAPTFGASTFRAFIVSASGTAGADKPVTYFVTPVGFDGEEGVATAVSTGNALTLASPTTPVTLFISTANGSPNKPVSYYRIYKAFGDTNPGITSTGIGGYIGTTYSQIQSGLSLDGHFQDNGITPDFTNTPPIANAIFATTNNYPSTVAYIQQRRAFANTNNNPIGFWLSQPGLFSNFNFRSNPIDSDPVVGSIAGREVNSIQHLAELKFMLMLTAGAELYVQGNGNGVVTPSSINASAQSNYGASSLRPLRIADTLIFNQALGSFIRDLRFDFVINGYNGNDLTVFASHLFEGSSIVDWDYQKIPDSIVWAVRNDGTLLGLTYMREQQVLAWHRHDFTNGTVENVCCIPENGTYAVYLSIKRVINGTTVRYIERMASRIWSDVLNATYLDCFTSYNGTNTGAGTMTLTSPTGTFTSDGTAYQQSLTLKSSLSFFTADMVGNQIFLSDADFVANKGNMVDPEDDGSSFALSVEGNQIRCTIISYTSAFQVTVLPNRAVPTTLQNVPITTWSRAVKTVTGLDYLKGQQVSVWADRFVVASPNNSDISFQATVALDGSLTLDKCYAVIYVGLPITSDLETLDLETAFGETMIGKRKRQNKLYAHLYNTRTLWAGSENPDSNPDNTDSDPLFQMEELKTGTYRQTYDQPPDLLTEQEYIGEVTRWNKNGRIFIRNVDPTPLTILAVVPAGDSPASNPAYERA